jgi:hypothetical protein
VFLGHNQIQFGAQRLQQVGQRPDGRQTSRFPHDVERRADMTHAQHLEFAAFRAHQTNIAYCRANNFEAAGGGQQSGPSP